MAIFSTLCAIALAVYLCYESAVSRGKYQELKQAIARGDRSARGRFYRDILVFECVSAALAFAALQFDPARFDPARLGLAETAFGRSSASVWARLDAAVLTGLIVGAVGGSVMVIFAMWWRARRQAPNSSPSQSPLSRILPDFGALLPSTGRERLLFALVALSAGLCEEVVFRAWLLDVLHRIGFDGLTLVALASVVFGLAHYYQGIVGIVVTGLLAVVFCVLYFVSGTLWVPIVVHAVIDLRAAIMPAMAPTDDKSSREGAPLETAVRPSA
jgi:membrane protease YdiL (CAAX protease family)